VTGRLRQRNYETKEGEKRTVYEVEVDDVGPSLRNASAKVNKVSRGSGEGGFGGGTNRPAGGGYSGGQGSPSSGSSSRTEDPWASSDSGGGYSDEPPF
jgi:single-strand DNA-binding protein